MFNCGEGTQRLAHEHKTKLSRLEHIFMTRTSWSHIGGLPGLCLTVQDAGVPELTIHGPPGLEEMFKATRRFVILKDLKINSVESVELKKAHDDSVMSVIYVPMFRKSCLSDNLKTVNEEEDLIAVDSVDYYAYETKNRAQFEIYNSMKKLARRNEESVTAYICTLKPRPGTLDLEKCVEYGVPPGPLLGQLKNGYDVALSNGTIVMSKDVRGPDDPGTRFICKLNY